MKLKAILTKLSNFINNLQNYISKTLHFLKCKISYIISIGKYIYTELDTVRKSDLEIDDDPTVKEMFRDWLFEILQYGLILTIITSSVTSYTVKSFILTCISFGMLRWLIFDSIRKTKKIIN